MREDKNKKIVVIYYDDDWIEDQPAMPETTRQSFEDWHIRGLESGIEMFRSFIKWYDYDRNVFIKAWAFRQGKWIKIEKPISPDMIFDKLPGRLDYEMFDFKMKLSQKVKLFNHPLFRTNLDNKLSQYLILGEFMPESFLAINKENFQSIATREFANDETLVIKPLYGSGGFGIVIDKKSNIDFSKLEYPVFIQKFITSENGIPGFSKGKEVADFRMIFLNHNLVYALSRIAKEGSLFTNFHQGAKAVLVPKNKIPEEVKFLAKKIIQKLAVFPEAHYSLDFIFTNEGVPILVEMNTTPGFDLLHIVGTEKLKKKNFDQFMSIIKK